MSSFENLPSIVFATPSVPLTGDRNLPYPFSKITPSLFTLKEGSTSHLGLLSSGEKKKTAPPRRSEPLCSKVGGPSKVFAMLCGMGPPGEKRVLSLKFIVYNLWFTACIRGILLIYCEFLGVLEYAYWHLSLIHI